MAWRWVPRMCWEDVSEESLSKKDHDTAIFRAKKTEGKLCLQEEEEGGRPRTRGICGAVLIIYCCIVSFSPNLASPNVSVHYLTVSVSREFKEQLSGGVLARVSQEAAVACQGGCRPSWPGLSEPLSGWRAHVAAGRSFRLLGDTQESPLPDHTELLLGLVECSPTTASGCPQNGQLRRLRQKSQTLS